MAAAALHRLEEIGFTKAYLARVFRTWYDRPADDTWANRVKALLASRRTTFTLEELEDLIAVADTSHHQCVLENPEEHAPRHLAQHDRLERRIRRADEYIRQALLAEAPERIA